MTKKRATVAALETMMRKAEEKLVAARLAKNSGLWGEVASRSYYAVFHAACAALAHRGLSYSSHAQTLGAFNREFVKSGVFRTDTYRKLQRLFEDRQVADYDWSVSVDSATAELDLEDAEIFVRDCRTYLEKTTGRSFSKN